MLRTGCAAAAIVGFGGCKSEPELLFTDANNYTYSGVLDIATIEVAEQSELTIDWSAMTTDIRGRPLDPTTVQQAAVLEVKETKDETIGLVERNELASSQDAKLYDNAGGTDAPLSEFVVINDYISLSDLVEDSGTTWLISILNVSLGVNDLLMSAVFAPTAGSDNTVVALTDTTASLAVDVDLHSATPIPTEADIGPYTLDWSEVKNDVFGHEYNEILGDMLIVGRYETEDVSEIEASFLQLDTNAAELYRADAYGLLGVDLDEAVDVDGREFGGFTKEGTWFVGILCTTCATPVPLLLSIVDVK